MSEEQVYDLVRITPANPVIENYERMLIEQMRTAQFSSLHDPDHHVYELCEIVDELDTEKDTVTHKITYRHNVPDDVKDQFNNVFLSYAEYRLVRDETILIESFDHLKDILMHFKDINGTINFLTSITIQGEEPHVRVGDTLIRFQENTMIEVMSVMDYMVTRGMIIFDRSGSWMDKNYPGYFDSVSIYDPAQVEALQNLIRDKQFIVTFTPR